jgi:membrane dipeptidase
VVNVIFYPEHLEPGWQSLKQKVDVEIAAMVQEASAAESGGVVQKKLARDRVRQREYVRRLPPVKVARIVDHVDHIVKLVGVDHVGIGSDFDGIQITASDLSTVAELPNLTRELLRRGYTESDVQKILGGNMLRVLEAHAR